MFRKSSRSKVLLIASLVFGASFSPAGLFSEEKKETTNQIPAPAKYGVVYYLKNDSLIPLERTPAKSQIKSGAGFFKSVVKDKTKLVIEVKGNSSRLSIDDPKPLLIVKMPPQQYASGLLFQMESKGKKREVIAWEVEGNNWSGTTETKMLQQQFYLETKPVSGQQNVFTIQPLEDLAAGEYAFSLEMIPQIISEMFCFRVDKKDSVEFKSEQ